MIRNVYISIRDERREHDAFDIEFEKKNMVIEATQWFKHGDHPEVTQSIIANRLGWLDESGELVFPGDYIIKNNGEYSVKPQEEFKEQC